MGATPLALDGIRVLDLSDELAAYASRLLGDLGADILRVEPRGGSPLRRAAPLVTARDGSTVSAFDHFVNAGKATEVLDAAAEPDRARLATLVAASHVVIESPRPVLEDYLTADEIAGLDPGLVRIIVTPFGLDQTREWPDSDDLLVMAEGGLLHLGGYTDVGPVVAYGKQSRFAASIFAAVAAMTGVMAREATGVGGSYDVSAQECIAQALEDSAATYSLTGMVRERLGERPREAGTGVYSCQDGFVSMVAGRLGTARAWTALVEWLNEEGAAGAAELLGERWQRFDFRQTDEAIETFATVFEGFASTRTKADLYRGAQARMIALSPVSTVSDLFANEQLRFREFFVEVDDPDLGTVVYPRAPYYLSRTPARDPRPVQAPTARNAELLDEGAAR